jgi:asparaginyl-tRNA synthetase
MRIKDLSPYRAHICDGKKLISYTGNKVNEAIEDVDEIVLSASFLRELVSRFSSEEFYFHLHRIDNAIFQAAVDYFRSIEAQWCNLPLTTRMISSPGEVYAGQTLDYTTDTAPIQLTWFDEKRNIFLSESSQFYLELRLLTPGISRVFSIYNSFRKEKADFSHLSEFQHIEFEGQITFQENVDISVNLLRAIVKGVLADAGDSMGFFRSSKEISLLQRAFSSENIEILTFYECLQLLREHTGLAYYESFSLENFGAWEEIFLTNLLDKHLIVTEFPILQIPFYHNTCRTNELGQIVAENADFILAGYREVIGSGVRITDPEVLMQKAQVFNLPPEDYAPYIQSRLTPTYKPSAGFGLGWQRLVHWLLKLPAIWSACHVPRGHINPIP